MGRRIVIVSRRQVSTCCIEFENRTGYARSLEDVKDFIEQDTGNGGNMVLNHLTGSSYYLI